MQQRFARSNKCHPFDLTRPVPREVLIECIDIAHQSPTGSNSQRWRWMIIEDAAKRKAIADIYRTNFEAAYAGAPEPAPGSLYPWHQISEASRIRRRYRRFCASVPWSMSNGPTMDNASKFTNWGDPMRVSSS